MFDPNIKLRVIADFKYKDEYYLTANTHLVFDIYDSVKIAELVSLYNPYYEYKDHIELPSVESLPYHVKQQLEDTYNLNKPADSSEYLPTSDKPFYETLGETFSPYGASPYEDENPVVVPLADNTYEPEIVEPKFPQLFDIEPSNLETEGDKKDKEIKDIEPESTFYEEVLPSKTEYSEGTKQLLALSDEDLNSKTANEIKLAVLEINPDYSYTNKTEAINYLLTFK